MSDPDELQRAQKVVDMIKGKVTELLRPLEREMIIMKYHEEYQVIMWEAVALEAIARSRKITGELP